MKSVFPLILLSLVVITTNAFAIPIRPTEPTDLEGEIVSWVWIDEVKWEGDGKHLRVLVGSREEPTYWVILKTDAIPKDLRESLSHLARMDGNLGISHALAFYELDDDEVLVKFHSDKSSRLKAGSKLKIKDYSLSGNEGGTTATFSSVEVDGKVLEAAKPPVVIKEEQKD